MTLRVALVIDGDARGAKSALDETASAVGRLEEKTGGAAEKTKALGDNSEKAATGLGKTAAEGEKAATGIGKAGTAADGAQGKFSTLSGILTRLAGAAVGGAIVGVFVALADNAVRWVQSILDNSPKIEADLKSHKDLIGDISGAYGAAARGAEDYGRKSVAVLRFGAQQNVRNLQADLAASGQPIPLLNERQFTTGEGMFQQVRDTGPFLDAINEFNRSVREGNPDAIKFRDTVTEIAAAFPADSEQFKNAEALFESIKKTADIQSNLAQARDAVKGFAGDANAMSDALGGLPKGFLESGDAASRAAQGVAEFKAELQALSGVGGGAISVPATGGGFGSAPAQFASGGVVSSPTLFRFGQGQLGLMGEAGPEAIMPLMGGRAVGAIGADGQEYALPLARLASGALGVQAFAGGGVIGATSSALAGLGGELVKGTGWGDAFSAMLARLTQRLLEMSIETAIAGNGKGFSGIAGILMQALGIGGGTSGIGAWTTTVTPAARGAAFGGGGPILVPSAPRARSIMAPSIAGNSFGGMTLNMAPITISADGADREQLARVELELYALRRALPGMMIETVRDARSRRAL